MPTVRPQPARAGVAAGPFRAIRLSGSPRKPALEAAASPPTPAPGEALIRPLRVPITDADLAALAGHTEFTGTLGSDFVGVVESVHPVSGPDAGVWVGKRVVGSPLIPCGTCDLCKRGLSPHCQQRRVLGLWKYDGALADLFTLPIANLVEVPKALDDDAASFANLVAACVHASRVTRLEGKTYVTILGDGAFALVAAQIMARLNTSTRVLGTHNAKFSLCERWGIRHRHISEVGRRHDQDVVVETSGQPAMLEFACHLCRPRGKIILCGSAGPVPMEALTQHARPIDLTSIASQEIEVLGASAGSPRDGLEKLANRDVDVSVLVSRRVRLAEGLRALSLAKDPESLRVLVEP